MKSGDLEYLRDYVRSETGIVLDNDKVYYIEYSLSPICEAEGLDSIATLVIHLRRERRGRLHKLVLDAITIKETLFSRRQRFRCITEQRHPQSGESGYIEQWAEYLVCAWGQNTHAAMRISAGTDRRPLWRSDSP